MSLTNLTSSNYSQPTGFFQTTFKNNENTNTNELIITNNSIIIPKSKIPQLRKQSGFFEAFIDRNFTNSNEYFDSKGNYILKKELLPEVARYYDKNTNEDYVIKRNEVWKALSEVLSEGHTSDIILGKFIADYFNFHDIYGFFNPTLPELNTVAKPNGSYIPEPSRATLKKGRRINKEIGYRNYINNNNEYNNYYNTREQLLENFAIDKAREEIRKKKVELRREKKGTVENLAEALHTILKNKVSSTFNKAKRATNNSTKKRMNKSKIPGTLLTTRMEKYKGKRETERRNKQRARKTLKQMPNRNNNQYENNEYEENPTN
jgi:hypothetical protein